MTKSRRNLKTGKGTGEKEKLNQEKMTESDGIPMTGYVVYEEAFFENDLDSIPALLGEVKELAVTPFGTYGLTDKRLLRSVILFGTASFCSNEGNNKRNFVLDDMTGKMLVESEIEETLVIPSNVIVIGTFERRNGINNVRAKHIRAISLNETKTVGTWHTLKVIESINVDVKSASRASELLKKNSFLSLIRRSKLNSNRLSLRHLIFAVNADKKPLEMESESTG